MVWECHIDVETIRRAIMHRIDIRDFPPCTRPRRKRGDIIASRSYAIGKRLLWLQSFRVVELPKHMGLQRVRRTLGCTDLPKHEIFGKNGALRNIDALLVNNFLQAVDVGIYRGSNFEWRRISFDKTPKRNVRHRGRMRQVCRCRSTVGGMSDIMAVGCREMMGDVTVWCGVEEPEAGAVTWRCLPFPFLVMLNDSVRRMASVVGL